MILGTVPFALVGGVWLLWMLGHIMSVAGAMGFVALAGVAAEFGVVMLLLYLNQAWAARQALGAPPIKGRCSMPSARARSCASDPRP